MSLLFQVWFNYCLELGRSLGSWEFGGCGEKNKRERTKVGRKRNWEWVVVLKTWRQENASHTKRTSGKKVDDGLTICLLLIFGSVLLYLLTFMRTDRCYLFPLSLSFSGF